MDRKKVNLYLVKSSQKSVSKQLWFFKLDRFTQINFALSCCQVEHASPIKNLATRIIVRFPSNKVKAKLLLKRLSSYPYDLITD